MGGLVCLMGRFFRACCCRTVLVPSGGVQDKKPTGQKQVDDMGVYLPGFRDTFLFPVKNAVTPAGTTCEGYRLVV